MNDERSAATPLTRSEFTARRAVAPDLRFVSRFVPRGMGLRYGYRVQQATMGFIANSLGYSDVLDQPIANGVSVRIHRPLGPARTGPAMLWIHSGGGVMGTAKQDDRYCRWMARHANVTVAAVDYRLAPGNPYPAPLQDCHRALSWLSEQQWVDATRLAVGGASAGGRYAAALAHLARDRGGVPLACQLLVYPMLDDRTGSRRTGRSRLMWSESDNQRAWRWYLRGADPHLAVPARRTDLSQLPPAWIGVGTLDLFYQEAVDYAQRLRAAGNRCHLEVVDGGFHGFDQVSPRAATSKAFLVSQCEYLRQALPSGTGN